MKRVLAAVLAASLALSMAACAQKTDTPAPEAKGTDQAAAAATEAPKDDAAKGEEKKDDAAAPAASGDVIKIGHFGPLTGAISASGQYAEKGLRLKVKQINEAGGINGKQLELIAYDDKGTAEAAVKAATRLIDEDKVTAIIGSQLSGNIQAAGERVEAAKVPLVGTGVSPVWLSNGWTYLFRALSNSTGGAAPLAEAMKQLGSTKVATIVYQDEGSMSAAKQVVEAMKAAGIEITDEEVFQPNDTDWTGQFSKMISTNPNGILLLAQGEHVAPMMTQLRGLGYKGYVYGQETMSLPDIRKVGGENANGIVFYAPHCVPDAVEEANTDKEKAFLEAFSKEYGEMPASDVAYRAYDAMTILAEGLTKANSTDGTAIRDALKGISGLEVLAGTIDYTQFDNGEGMKGMQVFITHNGKNMLLDNFLKDNAADTYKPN